MLVERAGRGGAWVLFLLAALISMINPSETARIKSIKVSLPAPRARAGAMKMRVLRESGAASNTPVRGAVGGFKKRIRSARN
ncbi:MAG: hypothetical protein FWD42_09370, partial [Solirubrobacterales bacterium]|nr:hypothetical protein [Solirubrobacterales bacterium]